MNSEEDLDLFEILFIKHKSSICKLYNDNRGGGGGWSHSDEAPTTYAIPNSETAPFTPEKYYLFQKDDEGRIRPQFTPGFKRKLKELREGLEDTQEMAYVIKKMDTEERYIGISVDPYRRSNEHGCLAEYHDSEHEKYDPARKGGLIHPALAEDPERFGVGLLPVQSKENIEPNEQQNYILLDGIAKVEKFAIKAKHSHFSENGYNGNRGGGGPISRRATSLAKKN